MENPCQTTNLSETSDRAFVHFITGGINTGKTGTLLSIYHKLGRGDGFINSKLFDAGLYIGQRIVRLSTGESECFSLKEGFIPSNWEEECRYEVYSFSKRGMAFANRVVNEIIEKRVEPAYIDEIGPLELHTRGFYGIFAKLLLEKKEVYVTVRSSCLQNVIKAFKIERYQIIKV